MGAGGAASASARMKTIGARRHATEALPPRDAGGDADAVPGRRRSARPTASRHPASRGRAHESTIVLDDGHASDRHARLYPHRDSQWIVETNHKQGGSTMCWLGRPIRGLPPESAAAQDPECERTWQKGPAIWVLIA
ncbi:FHA domain-containing protein [Streptomyces sp. NPDC050564]|uniref:FHA domain-containing protein n=1 Tax=Streptomyces sp. NPDC050564 TaxID=3365631 RepID=UPI0037969588